MKLSDKENKGMMKRVRAIILVLIMCVSAFSGVQNAQAASSSYKKNIKNLVNHMGRFETCVLLDGVYKGKFDKKKNITLTPSVKAKAAALEIYEPKKAFQSPWDNRVWITKVSDKPIRKATLNLFGKSVSSKKMKRKYKANTYDAYWSTYYDCPVVETYEMENARYTYSIDVRKKGKNYVVVKKVFFGYWGQWYYSKNKKPNYQIVYKVKKNSKSVYGYVIYGMSIKKIK